MTLAEQIAAEFHRTYELLAPNFGYKTRDASAVPWEDVPEANKKLMVSVVQALLTQDVIKPGERLEPVPSIAESLAKIASNTRPSYGGNRGPG